MVHPSRRARTHPGKGTGEIAKTHFVPEQGRNRLGSMVAARPDWCISRQRAWGVPITVFVEERTGEPLRDPAVVARIVEAFKAEGADSWYASPPSRFLGNERDPDDYEQVMDIVDVWFESGSTHAFTLEDRGLPWPADLYLEGSDQHRGWFQSSLLESVGTRGVAPFKAILTDGFVMDEQGRKMSKSLGNVTAPQEVADKYGVDILRLWVMMSDTSEDLRIGPEILKQQAELYRRLRNTLRWLLGSLSGFTEAERVPYDDMPELEKWVLHRLTELDTRIRASVQSYDWTGVYPELHNFCATDLSAFYFDVRKDAIYCDRPDSLRRRAARTVLDHLHRCLTKWLAPVMCFTAEEAWCARFGESDSVHLQLFPDLPAEWRDDALAARWSLIRERRRIVTAALETMRQQGQIGSSLQAEVALLFDEGQDTLLTEELWAEVLIVPTVVFSAAGRQSDKRKSWRRNEMRALLAGAARGRSATQPSDALCAMRRCGGVGAGLPRVTVRGPSHEPQWSDPARPSCRDRGARGRSGQQIWVLHVIHLPEIGQIVVLPVLNLTMVWNRGVTFGLLNGFGQWGSVALAGVALAVVVALGVWLRRAELPLVATALGAIAGGAISNVSDRVRFGAVVDFIHAHVGGWSWYVFNLADAAIVCGVAALVLESLLPRAGKSRSPKDASAG